MNTVAAFCRHLRHLARRAPQLRFLAQLFALKAMLFQDFCPRQGVFRELPTCPKVIMFGRIGAVLFVVGLIEFQHFEGFPGFSATTFDNFLFIFQSFLHFFIFRILCDFGTKGIDRLCAKCWFQKRLQNLYEIDDFVVFATSQTSKYSILHVFCKLLWHRQFSQNRRLVCRFKMTNN